MATSDTPFLDPEIHYSTEQPLEYDYPGDQTPTAQLESSPPSAENLTQNSDSDDTVEEIGSVLSNGKFICNYEDCAALTFSRLAELRRHYTTLHSLNKPNFWCGVLSCPRSMHGGGGAFHRKDKMMAHVRSVHPGMQ